MLPHPPAGQWVEPQSQGHRIGDFDGASSQSAAASLTVPAQAADGNSGDQAPNGTRVHWPARKRAPLQGETAGVRTAGSGSDAVTGPALVSGQEATALPTQRQIIATEWRSNWRTGLAVMLGMGLGTSISPNLFSLFVEPLQQSFGWSRGQIALAHNASLVAAVTAPFAGRLIDRLGARRLIMAGFLMVSLFYLSLAAMQGPIGVFYLLFTGLTVCGLFTTGLSFSRVISATFIGSRGFSLAVARSGLAISTGLLPSLLYAIMAAYGWRGGYLLLALLALGVALPATWLWIDRKPPIRAALETAGPGTPWLELVANRKVLTVAAAAALAYMPLLAIMSQLQPLLVGDGIAPATAAGLLGLLGVATLVGAIVTGLLVDRFWAPLIALIMMTGAAAGALLLGQVDGEVRIAAASVLLLGFAQGAEIDIVAFVVARYFGMKSFAAIYGITIFAIASCTALGVSLIGLLYDRTGSYDLALVLAAASFILSGIAYLTLGRYPRHQAD
jgi:predicted MFS family arabinose efflux permease